jgi:hypothetical protein
MHSASRPQALLPSQERNGCYGDRRMSEPPGLWRRWSIMAVNENRANAALSKRSDGHEAATNTGWRSSPSTPLMHRIASREREILTWGYASCSHGGTDP